MGHNRLLLYLGLYGLSVVLGLGLIYAVAFLATGSGTIAAFVVGSAAVLIAPLVIVSFYWSYRSEFKPIKISAEEFASVSRSSMLVAISSSFLIWGTLSFTNGRLSTGAVALTMYAALTVLQVRLLWGAKRRTYEGLIESTKPTAVSLSVSRAQRKRWIPIVIIGVAVQAFGWTGLYLIFQGLVIVGAVLCTIAALLCAPLLRRVQRAVVEGSSVT
jgi:hypothetical protein